VLTNDSPKRPSRPDRDRLREHVSHVAMIPLRGRCNRLRPSGIIQ
jgi:hypothetical protein